MVVRLLTRWGLPSGFERAPEPPPPPPRPRSPSPVKDERIEIRRRYDMYPPRKYFSTKTNFSPRYRGVSSNGRSYDDDIIFERETNGRRPLLGVHRGRTEEDLTVALTRTNEREREREPMPLGPPVRYEAREPRRDRLWTEITKDLVAEEAIRERGYEYEEAETSWFVMQHLRYVRLPFYAPDFRPFSSTSLLLFPRPPLHNPC